MAEGKKSFILYADLIHTVSKLPKEKAGELFLHILEYVNDKNPTTDDLILQLAFEPVKLQLKRDLEKWDDIRDLRKKAGKKSAEIRQQKQHMSTHVEFAEQNSTNANTAQHSSTNPTVNVNGTVNDTVTVKERENTPNLDFHASYDTVVEKTIRDEVFVEEAAMLAGAKTKELFLAFAEKKLQELKVTGKMSRYTVAVIRGILIKDYEEPKQMPIVKPKPYDPYAENF